MFFKCIKQIFHFLAGIRHEQRPDPEESTPPIKKQKIDTPALVLPTAPLSISASYDKGMFAMGPWLEYTLIPKSLWGLSPHNKFTMGARAPLPPWFRRPCIIGGFDKRLEKK